MSRPQEYPRDELGRDRHGRTAERVAWMSMRQRCLNAEYHAFKYYGGRGITITPRWDTFEQFLADMGQRPSVEHSLDRYPDPNGNYEPGNCRWATAAEQMRNRRDTKLTWDLVDEIRGRVEHGETHTAVAERIGIDRATVSKIWRNERWREPATGAR